MWDVHVSHWPPKEQWGFLLKETLKALCRTGAVVAWCGLEGHFADPGDDELLNLHRLVAGAIS